MTAADLHRHPFCEVYRWIEHRDPDLLASVDLLARVAHQSVWTETDRRARLWCASVEAGDWATAHSLAGAIHADAATYRPETRTAA